MECVPEHGFNVAGILEVHGLPNGIGVNVVVLGLQARQDLLHLVLGWVSKTTPSSSLMSTRNSHGAGGGTRTHTLLRASDFKSETSAISSLRHTKKPLGFLSPKGFSRHLWLRQMTCSTEAPRRTDNNKPVSGPDWFKSRCLRAPVGSVEIKHIVLLLRENLKNVLQSERHNQSHCGIVSCGIARWATGTRVGCPVFAGPRHHEGNTFLPATLDSETTSCAV